MRKFISLIVLIILVTGVSLTMAQDTTTTTTTTATQVPAATSSINIFFIACESQAVFNFDGTMEAGYDIYYQVFSGAGGGGTALTALRQVTVGGDYAVSDQVTYDNNQTVSAGATASARVIMAREGNPSSTIFEETVNDLQDGCNSPANPLASSTGVDQASDSAAATTGVRSPSGGNLSIVTPLNPIVVIGVPQPLGRSNKPGEIFAECDQYRERAEPGKLYNTDNIRIFWSWFARTEEQVQDHIDNAIYNVTFQTAPLQNVQISPIEKIGTNYWVFYTAPVGNLSPGKYGVNFKLTWAQQIDDGYEKYGPGTLNDRVNSTCTFEIEEDPQGDQAQVQYNGMYSLDR
ncbi:MAG: hypothetical protein CL610_21715 [Anaerolineaceae bacterium]|nr:hypothetical protein [Anaerolineaceae bacterium]